MIRIRKTGKLIETSYITSMETNMVIRAVNPEKEELLRTKGGAL